MDKHYQWQVQTVRNEHLTHASVPRRNLQEWISSGEIKSVVFSRSGMPTVSLGIKGPDTVVVFDKVIVPDVARMDCDRTLSLRSGGRGGDTGQAPPPKIKTKIYQRIGYTDPDGKSGRVWIDLQHGIVELK